MIRLYGPPGSGKTTLLKLLRNTLTKSDRKFLVIEFNALQHELIEPTWWPLLDTVVSQSIKKESPVKWYRKNWIWIRDVFFHKISRRHRNILIIAVVLFAVIGIDLLLTSKNTESLTTTTNSGNEFLSFINAHVAAIVALVGSIIGGIRAFGYSLLPNSSESAKDLMKTNGDPMKSLNSYFKKLVRRIKNPIVILVDDTEHCRSDYKKEFFDAIKTLFIPQTNVVFVITTNKLSLYGEPNIGNLGDSIVEIAKLYGYQTLNNIFDLSFRLPTLRNEDKKRYFENLLGTYQSETSEAIEESKEHAQSKLASLNSNQEVLDFIKNETDLSKKQVLKEEATRIFCAETESETLHYLKRYIAFMDSNPRSINQLVNSFQMWTAKIILSGKELVPPDKLARWLIITSRWPFFVDYLEDHVNLTTEFDKIIREIDKTKENKIDTVSKKQKEDFGIILREILISDSDLRSVIIGLGEMSALNGNTIRKLLTV